MGTTPSSDFLTSVLCFGCPAEFVVKPCDSSTNGLRLGVFGLHKVLLAKLPQLETCASPAVRVK